MRQLRTGAAFLAVWASALAAQGATPPGEPFGERDEVNVVNVEVYATDAGGRPAAGLQRSDFVLLEDGKPMEISNFAAIDRQQTAPPAAALENAPAAPAAAMAPAPADPFHLVVYIDNTHLSPAHRARALGQLRGALTRQLAAGDRVMVVTYDPGLHVRLPFTADRAALGRTLDGIEKLASGGGADERDRRAALAQIQEIQERALAAMAKEERFDSAGQRRGGGSRDDQEATSDAAGMANPCPPEIAEPAKSYAAASRQEVLRAITGLTVLVNSLSGLPGRKALLHVSDGVAVTPGEELFEVLHEICGGGNSAAARGQSFDAQLYGHDTYKGAQAAIDAQSYSTARQWSALGAHASAHRVTLYTLQASGLESHAAAAADAGPGDRLLQLGAVAETEASNRRGSLVSLAADTGGRAILDANDAAADLDRMAEDFNRYYSLGYTPPHQGDGHDHRIEVRVKRPGIRVRYRQLYRDKPALERAVDRTLAALFFGAEDNPLGVTMEIGQASPAPPSGYAFPVRLRIPLANLGLTMKSDAYEAKLRLLVTTRGAEGGNASVRQVEVPIRIPLQGSSAALAQDYLYELKLQLPAGEHRLAIGVRDDITTLASYLARSLRVGAKPATSP